MGTIFVSYAREDLPQVHSIAQDLAQLAQPVWFDRNLTGGQAWWDEVLKQIRGSDVMLVALSAAALGSEACSAEWGYAAQLRKALLPLRIATDVTDRMLPRELARLHIVDHTEHDRSSLIALLLALRHAPVAALPEPLPSRRPRPARTCAIWRPRSIRGPS